MTRYARGLIIVISLMEEFLGLPVSLDLADGSVIEGVIQEIDEARQVLILSGATSLRGDQNGREVSVIPGRLEIFGSDILNIELQDIFPVAPSDTKKKASVVASNKGSPLKKAAGMEWAKDDIRKIKSEDFDFQSNLKLFDKKQIFSEIKVKILLSPCASYPLH